MSLPVASQSARRDPAQPPWRPSSVLAACLVTWFFSTCTAVGAVVVVVPMLWLGDGLFDAFQLDGGTDPRWWVVAAVATVVGLAGIADLVAVLVFVGHRWARWALVLLSIIAALGGLFGAYFLLPLLITAAALTVIVLLLLPDARRWSRPSHMG